MNRVIFLKFYLFVFPLIILGQNSDSRSSFISLYIGDLTILSENFREHYGSKNDLTFGLGFGVPISHSITVDASISYFQKKKDFNPPINENSTARSNLEQFIYNAGLQLHLLPNRLIGLSFIFGINYATINEEWKNSDNITEYSLKDNGNLGVYGGANFEINLGRSPLAIHGDIKYTYCWDSILDYDENYRELKYMGGIKLYLAKKW